MADQEIPLKEIPRHRLSDSVTQQPAQQADSSSNCAAIANEIKQALTFRIGRDPATASPQDWYQAAAAVLRDRLISRWLATNRRQRAQNVKRVYYLSMEFLVGRAMSNALHATELFDDFSRALQQLGLSIDWMVNEEPDAALGNGGLGRLAACFLDSMAALDVPGIGYGIRYDFGMFAQGTRDGRQVEMPDEWLRQGNPWEIRRAERTYPVRFGGHVTHDGGGATWHATDLVRATAYDNMIPGADTQTIVTLRLWHAQSAQSLDLARFNQGDYMEAVRQRTLSENVTRVLYPDDSSRQGRELRLRQEYFFVSASVQDILRRYLEGNASVHGLEAKAAIHLNDTHPAIAVPELMRLLVDAHKLEWTQAWSMCTRIFSYTNHTIMPEALETWPIDMLGQVLPRHLEIIYEINRRFLNGVREKFGHDDAFLARLSIVDPDDGGRVRMASLSVVASHQVNGVSKLHSDLIARTLFADFAKVFPERFCNMTNGITPRRWLAYANRGLAGLIDDRIGKGWRADLNQLQQLREHADDRDFIEAFATVKRSNKRRLMQYCRDTLGVVLNPDSMFDVQIKRMHEYKRQLLNVMHVIWRYQAILARPDAGWTPRTVLFAGKAASAYGIAKLIIKLINDVAVKVNNDPRIGDLLKVVFVPNYGVTIAELIIPAADLSEQISTAGTEASGTGNMKLALNGALTIGTLDGANIEIRDQVGDDNIFIFGLNAADVSRLRVDGYSPSTRVEQDPELARVLDTLTGSLFCPDEPGRFMPLHDQLLRHGDRYLLLADFRAYIDCQRRVDQAFASPTDWTRSAIHNVAGMGIFSSDRTIAEYASRIWGVRPLVWTN